MTPRTTIRRALSDPNLLGSVLAGDSWAAWRVLLIAAMGEPLDADETALFQRLTGRDEPPPGRVEELLAVVGRRGGKSTAMAALGCYLATMCTYDLSVGEKGVVLLIAPNQRQAKVALDYMHGILESTPILAREIVGRTADSIELANRISIEVRSASFRRLRGLSCVAVIADEASFWLDGETSSNPDAEIFNAVRPSLATTGGPLVIISSPYARRGEVWETYRRHYGADGDAKILVAQGTSRDFNPSLPQAVVDRAIERDEAAARAEYLAEFRTDIEAFITIEAVRSCIETGVRERAPVRQHRYIGFADPSGGSSDAFTLAIAHKEGATAILDLLREVKPPFSPEAVTEEFAETLKRYRITRVIGDRYGGEFPRELFRRHGVNYQPCDKPKSDLYRDMLPLINSRCVDLLDSDRLVRQLVSLERRTARGGKDSIDHAPNAHDDLANSAAGAIVTAFSMSTAELAWRQAGARKPVVRMGHEAVRRRFPGSQPGYPITRHDSGLADIEWRKPPVEKLVGDTR